MHYSPYRKHSRAAFDACIQKLHDEIPRLSEAQIASGLMWLAAMAGDGHTGLCHPVYIEDAKKLVPVQFYLYEEGLFITAAAPAQAELAGAQVPRVGGHTIDQLLAALDPVISQDNRIGLKLSGPNRLRNPFVLHGLGLTPDADKVALTIHARALAGFAGVHIHLLLPQLFSRPCHTIAPARRLIGVTNHLNLRAGHDG